uniref:preprotein translocase SecG subunit n=1 Tax=Gloiopeltis furcata TaxID=42017 RepID=UPI0028D53719|nr:preprotein translocase SecG subunit [Gloiopeltis furcata]WMP13908.1 preprotein translocase SecG subunit [Gloiopeltis furcata]
MKLIWYVASFFTIFLILINNPKATSLSGFSDQGRIFNSTRSTQKSLQIVIAIHVVAFFSLTILFALYSQV